MIQNVEYLKGAGRKVQEDLFLIFGARAGLDDKIDETNIFALAMRLAEILKYISFAKSHIFLARMKLNAEIESVKDIEYLVEMFRNVLFAATDTVFHGRKLLDGMEKTVKIELEEDQKRWFKKYKGNVIESMNNIIGSCNDYVNTMSPMVLEIKSEVDAAIDKCEEIEKIINEKLNNAPIELEIKKQKAKQDALLEFYKAQLRLLEDHKKAGAEIDKEILELQEKLLSLEGDQNKNMVQDLLITLQSLQS